MADYNDRTRRLTNRLRSLSMEMESLPTQKSKEWRMELKDCFTDSSALVQALKDISMLNDDLDKALSDNTFKSDSLFYYQEHLDAFVGLYIHTKAFVGRANKGKHLSPILHDVFSSLGKQKCPNMPLFRRLAINPAYIASDNTESRELLTTESFCLPVAQMARMCDVAILRFLSSVTDKTYPDSIVWALDYLTEMTKHLEASLRAQSEIGWCGIRFRKRKDTIRRSVIEAPKLALDGRPLVVGFGAPQSPTPGAPILGPDGDFPISRIPSILLSEDGSDSPSPVMRARRSSRDETSNVPPFFPPVQVNQPRQRRSSRDETPRRRSSVTAPQSISILEVPQRRSSTGTNPFASSGPPSSRKSSVVRSCSPIPIGTIVEEESSNRPNDLSLKAAQPNSLRPSSPNFIPDSASPNFRTPSPCVMEYEALMDSIPTCESVKILHTPPDSEDDEDEELEGRSASPLTPAAFRTTRTASPSPSISSLKHLTPEQLKKEVSSLVTAEGRISLLALLQAISRLPSTLRDLWTEGSWDACQKCFQLIQFCMDFGLDTSQQVPHQRSYNNPCSDSFSNLERPSKTYSRLVLQHSLLALIHCAKSMYTGCFSDGCRLSMYTINNSRGGGQILNKMTHQLERLYSNSSLHFREVAMSFARQAPCRQVFHFLHVILQYCPKGPGKDPLDPSLSKRDPLIVLTAAMLRILVDRLNELDLTEQSIQQGIVQEAIAFVHFALCLFSQDFISQRSFRHLYLYIQRVALSVLLPIPAPSSTLPLNAQSSLEQDSAPTDFGTFPRKKNKEGSEGTPRRRAPTVPGPGYEAKSPQAAKRNPLQKQPSLHHDPNPDPIELPQIPVIREWRGLNLTVLQMRVRRLSMLMELSEPGKIPEPSLLASLIAVGAPGSVVPRALVFLECSLFVQRLREGYATLWLQNQGEHVGLDVLLMLQKSGKVVGETLRQIELSEKELQSQTPIFSVSSTPDENTPPSPPLVVEEPILPDEERNPEKRYTVSYAVKMAACIYLMELTKLLREPPKSLLPTYSSQAATGHTFSRSISTERRPSNMSSVSTDSETSRPNFPNPYDLSRPQQIRRLSSEVAISSSAPNPMLDEIPRFASLDAPSSSPSGFLDAPSSPTPRKLSVFLKVNSRHGRISRAPIHHPRVSHYGRQGETQVPPDTFKATSPTHSPTKSSFRTRRMSSAAAFGGARIPKQPNHDAAGSVRYHAQPTVTVTTHQKSHRRMSMAATMIERPKKDSSPNPPPHGQITKPPSQSNLKVTGSPTNPHSRHRVSVIGRFRKFAFRQHRGKNQESKKRASTTTQSSSHSSSPMTYRRGTSHSYNRSESMVQCQVEDLQRSFPWLDVVEYLVTSSQCSEPDVRAQRRRACQDLLQALQQVYGGGHDDSQPDSENEASAHRDLTSTLGTIFSNTVIASDSSTRSRDRADSVNVATRFDLTANNQQSAMTRLDFSGIPLSSFIQLGMDGLSIENFLESDCATAPSMRRQQHNKLRLDFIHRTMSGLLHAPFSLIVYAAPVLSMDSFTYLREIAWDTLLDADQDLSVAAAAFFLLSCSKEKDRGLKKFIQEKAKESHNNNAAKKQIIERFVVLWRTRGLVWPRMEEYAQTHFMGGSEEDSSTKDSQVIGYSVPTNLLSSPVDSMPHAPWEPASVCSNQTKTCMQHSERCYQGTLHAPLYHLNDVMGVSKKFPVSSLNIQHETGCLENTYVAVVDHQDYEQGIITITDRLSSNLFPSSLLPLISFVISTLNHWPSSRHVSGTESATETTTTSEVSAAAEVAVWQCMVDNPQLFFAPLLHQFNTVYQRIKRHESIDKRETDAIAVAISKPFRTLLSHFSTLPIKTAQFLFVHFVGIIMRHTEQALPSSNIIVHCVLEMLRMVAPNVQGLSMKELKNSLKKESCYTTILSTARIRGVEKIRLITHDDQEQEQEVDDSDMTFALMIAKAQSQNDLEIQSIIQHFYLKDERTKVPVLSTLVIQDHYAAHTDTYIPAFSIQYEPANKKKETAIWTEQLDMLLVHKMSECSRLLFTSEMLHSSYNESKNPAKKRYSIPNHEFIYNELLELSSFPRKALESLPYEMGAQALSRQNLCIADNMLRGSWARFMHNLFVKLEKPVDNSIILFLSVVTGSLLLQCEDHTVLRSCLATLLTAAMKFSSVFKLNGYQMVVPTLVQVYALHSKNKLVTEAIKFIWVHFYWKSKNRFLLQVIASVTNLLSSEVGNLAIVLGANFSPLNVSVNEEEDEDEKQQLAKTLMDLLEALNVSSNDLPKDTLDILGECPPDIAAMFVKEKTNLETWTPCSLEIFITLCVTVASFNPEVLRGMQVLVALDRLMPLLVCRLNYREALVPAVRSLIRGCDTIRHPALKSDLFTRRGQTDNEAFHTEEGPRPPHVKRLLFFRRRQGTSQDIPSHFHARTHSVSEFPATIDNYLDGFRERNRRQQDVSQKVLRIVCASLLSITSQLACHVACQKTSPSYAGGTLTLESIKPSSGRLVLDHSSLQTLSTIAIQLLRLASKVHYEEIIYCKGLVRFMHDLLPNVEWTNDNITVFGNIIERLVKLFKKIQAETSKLSPLVWDGLTAYLQGVLLCVQHNRSIVTDSEHITAKLKALLDVFLTIKQIGLGSAALHTSRPKITHQLIYEAPHSFTFAIIELSTEMILATRTYPRQQRVQLDTLFRGKLHFKDRDLSEFFWAQLFLPVVTQLELKEQSQFTDEDISFVMENIMSVSDHVLVHISQSIPNSQVFKRYFNVMKVLVCAMSKQFDLGNWLQITHMIINITTKFDANSQQRPGHTATVAQYTVYAQFCGYFVDFVEHFVVSCRAPLLGFLWPCLSTIEKQLHAAQNQLSLQDNETISSSITTCLSQCAAIKSWSSLSSTAESRGELLESLQLELHSPSSSSSPPPGSLTSDVPYVTTSSDEPLTQVPRLKRKNSRPPNYPAIQEITEVEPLAATPVTPQHRPTKLGLLFESDRSPKMGFRSFSPTNRPKVTFADQVPQVQSKTLPPKRQMKKSDGESRQSRKRYMRGDRGVRRKVNESSCDADDEEMETPRSSVTSYPSQTWPSRQDSLTSFSSMNTVTTNLSLDSPPSSDTKTEVTVHDLHSSSSPRHHALEPSTVSMKVLKRQEAVETPSEDEGEEEMEDEDDDDDLSFAKLIVKPAKSNRFSGNAVPVSLETDESQLYEDDNSDHFQNSLKKSLLYLSSSLPESHSHIT